MYVSSFFLIVVVIGSNVDERSRSHLLHLTYPEMKSSTF